MPQIDILMATYNGGEYIAAIGACITVSATELLVAVLMAYNFKKNIGLCLS